MSLEVENEDLELGDPNGASETTLIEVRDKLNDIVGLELPKHDAVTISYVTSGNGIGEVEIVTYKLGSNTVLTLSLTYDSNNRINGYTKS